MGRVLIYSNKLTQWRAIVFSGQALLERIEIRWGTRPRCDPYKPNTRPISFGMQFRGQTGWADV